MKVKVIKCSRPTYWYSDKIGEVFKVKPYNNTDSPQFSYCVHTNFGQGDLLSGDDVELFEDSWDGQTFPPIGTVCEYGLEGNKRWHKCTIKAVTDDYVIFLNEHDVEGCLYKTCFDFRRIKTPLEIAAEGRDKKVRELHSVLFPEYSWELLRDKYRQGLYRAIDAGYQKVQL